MSKINPNAQTFTLDALDLDPIEKNSIKRTLSGLYGEDTQYTVWKLANAWSIDFMQDGASDLAINEHGDEPGDAWLITKATDETRALHFFRRKRTND